MSNETTQSLEEEVQSLRALAAVCYAGLGAECNLPEKWLDVLSAAANGERFSTEGLLPFVSEHSNELPKGYWLAPVKLTPEMHAAMDRAMFDAMPLEIPLTPEAWAAAIEHAPKLGATSLTIADPEIDRVVYEQTGFDGDGTPPVTCA